MKLVMITGMVEIIPKLKLPLAKTGIADTRNASISIIEPTIFDFGMANKMPPMT